MEFKFQCRAKVLKCIAGDDIHAILYVGIAGIQLTRRLRLAWVKTPQPDIHDTTNAAEEVRRYVEEKLLHNEYVTIELVEELTTVYIRVVVHYLDENRVSRNLNKELEAMGYSFSKD